MTVTPCIRSLQSDTSLGDNIRSSCDASDHCFRLT